MGAGFVVVTHEPDVEVDHPRMIFINGPAPGRFVALGNGKGKGSSEPTPEIVAMDP